LQGLCPCRLALVAEIDAAGIASAAIDIVQREHAGHLASFEMDACARLRLAYKIVAHAEDEVDCLWRVAPQLAMTDVAPLRRCAVAQIELVAPEFVRPDQADRDVFEGILRAYCQMGLAKMKRGRVQLCRARKRAGY